LSHTYRLLSSNVSKECLWQQAAFCFGSRSSPISDENTHVSAVFIFFNLNLNFFF